MIVFNIRYFLTFILILIIEVLIAAFCKQPFIRNIFGDFLATLLLYYLFKAFFNIKSIYIAAGVLVISFFIEFLQLIDIINLLNIENKLLKIIIGTTFSFNDLVAYTIGISSAILFEKLTSSKFSN